MPRSKKIFVLVLAVIVILLGIVAAIRLFNPEDTWVCESGIWQKHGNPVASAPTDGCSAK